MLRLPPPTPQENLRVWDWSSTWPTLWIRDCSSPLSSKAKKAPFKQLNFTESISVCLCWGRDDYLLMFTQSTSSTHFVSHVLRILIQTVDWVHSSLLLRSRYQRHNRAVFVFPSEMGTEHKNGKDRALSSSGELDESFGAIYSVLVPSLTMRLFLSVEMSWLGKFLSIYVRL